MSTVGTWTLFIDWLHLTWLLFASGPALVRGLAEIVERRPNDPIEYLATFLYKQGDNTRAQRQVEIESRLPGSTTSSVSFR